MILIDVPTSNYWSQACPVTGGITNTTPVTYVTPGFNSRAYISDISCWNHIVSGSTVVEVASSGVVLWRGEVGQYAPGVREHYTIPLRGSIGGPITVQCLTAGQKVWVNMSGFYDSQ